MEASIKEKDMNRRRLAFSIALGAMLTLGLLVSLSFDMAPAKAQPVQATTLEHSDVISRALAYLQTRQLDSGGIESDWTSGTADDFTTIKTVIALAAARRPLSYMTSASGYTPLDYLETQSYTYTRDMTGTVYPGRLGMVIAAAVAGEGDPHAFGQYPAGHSSAGTPLNLVEELKATYHPATGAYSTTAKGPFTSGDANTTNQLWAIVGLASVQETVPVTATDFFAGLQESDGGWAWVQGSGGDVDMTGLAVQALIASGNLEPTHTEVQEGLDFLRDTQLDSGGWAGFFGSLSADSTAAAIQALAAAGYTPTTASWATSSRRTPHDDLTGLQEANGSFGNNALATAHAIAGLAEAPVPVLGRVQRANRALTWMQEQQNPDGSWSSWGSPDPGATCDAILAYAAAGFDPDSVTASSSYFSAIDYLSATASAFVTQSADSAGKLALAVEAAGGDAHDFGGVDIVHVLTNTWYSPTVGAFGDASNSWHQAFSILGLAAAGEPVPVSATQTLTGLQRADGSWTDAWGFDKPGSTGLALQALAATGVPITESSVLSGVIALQDTQNTAGSWSAFGSPSANSTAYAIQGLLAAGEDLEATRWLEDGHSPYNALNNLQKADGPFTLGPTDDFFSTRQAVPALLGVHYPFAHPLKPFVSVHRGPDPDRTVAADLSAEWSNSIDVVLPFGSDLDADGNVTLEWREVGASSWETTTVHPADGFYTATVSEKEITSHEFRATFEDPDGVQYGGHISETVVLPLYALEPHHIHLPLVTRNS
jgi:hypothetical protein